jgi:16S rRNA processing protein RimM
MTNFLEVGKITGVHGLKGSFKVIPLTDDPERFKALKYVYVENNGVMERHNIEETRLARKHVIVKFRGIDNVSDAENFRDKYILVDRENAVRLPENSFFICDIIGCDVYDETKSLLGKVTDVLHTGSNDVYVVKNAAGREYLVPALKSVVKNVSIAEKRIDVIIPEGLIENEV